MKLTTFRNVWTAYTYPDEVIDADWDMIAEVLMTFNEVKSKDEVGLFNLWQFDENGECGRKYKNKDRTEFEMIPNTIRRCAANAQGLWGLMLDFDNLETIESVAVALDGLEYVLYTTFNHSSKQDKFRVVMPFDRLMTIGEFNLKKTSIADTFSNADTASFSMSQSFYFHSGPDARVAIAYRAKGQMLNPDMFAEVEAKASDDVIYDISSISDDKFKELALILEQIKAIYPSPDYHTWLKITFATASEVGNAAAALLMSQFWPENTKGEYIKHLTGRDTSRSPKIGTLVYMLKQANKLVTRNNNRY